MIDKLSLKKKLALDLFRKYKKNRTELHDLSYLFWECTLRCNLNCKHCGSDCKTDSAQKDMPLIDFLNVLDQLKEKINPNKVMIAITGGEPLMRGDLEICGKEIFKRGFPWGMVTNGYAMTKDRLVSLLKSGLRSVTVSLDGFEESHNWLRGKEKSFQKAVHAIQLVSSLSDLVSDVVTCVNQKNIHELEKLKEFLIQIGVKQWRLFTIFPIGRARNNEMLSLSPDQFKSVFDFIKETRAEGLIKISYGCEGYLGNYEGDVRDNFFFCQAGINIASILVDGSISACPNLRENFIQGNIYSDNFMEIWNNNYTVMRDRSWTKKGMCKDCKSYKYCLGNGLHLYDENKELMFCHLQKLNQAN